jgi:hypothetical protein
MSAASEKQRPGPPSTEPSEEKMAVPENWKVARFRDLTYYTYGEIKVLLISEGMALIPLLKRDKNEVVLSFRDGWDVTSDNLYEHKATGAIVATPAQAEALEVLYRTKPDKLTAAVDYKRLFENHPLIEETIIKQMEELGIDALNEALRYEEDPVAEEARRREKRLAILAPQRRFFITLFSLYISAFMAVITFMEVGLFGLVGWSLAGAILLTFALVLVGVLFIRALLTYLEKNIGERDDGNSTFTVFMCLASFLMPLSMMGSSFLPIRLLA